MIRDSKPFSNGADYEWFCEQYCDRCRRYKEPDDGFPAMVKNESCPIRDKVDKARFGEPFPSDCFADLFTPEGKAIAFNVCRHFFTENEDELFQYFQMFADALRRKEQK